MIRKSVSIVGQVLGLFVDDVFTTPSPQTAGQYPNYYFQFRVY